MPPEILTSLHSQFLDGDVHGAIRRIGFEMRGLKSELSRTEWAEFVRTAPLHPICEILHQDPFSHHSFVKPRGYCGDADLLDLIYGYRYPPVETTELGRTIFSYTARTAPAPLSVQERLQRIAKKIDETSKQFADSKIMSVACGHLREAELSQAFQDHQLGCLMGLDADGLSIDTVRNRLGERQDLQLQNVDVGKLITGRMSGSGYHLVYSLGLYDYLEDRLATRLTAGLFNLLASGGTLLIANFMPHLHDAGYMEAFMNWPLIYRKPEELPILLARIDPALIAETKTYLDGPANIGYLEVVRG